MSNKTLIIIIVVLAIVVVGLVVYFSLGKLGAEKGAASLGEVKGTITSLYLESFPAGTQMGPGMKGEQKTSFKKDEIVELSGTAEVSESLTATVKIFDKDGSQYNEQPCVEIKGSGGFGCGLMIPQQAGQYTLKFYLEGQEVKTLSFEVIE